MFIHLQIQDLYSRCLWMVQSIPSSPNFFQTHIFWYLVLAREVDSYFEGFMHELACAKTLLFKRKTCNSFWTLQKKILSTFDKTIRLWSHRSILYTVFAIPYTICSPPQTTFKWCGVEAVESRLWRRANRIAYSEYCIMYTSMWLQPS